MPPSTSAPLFNYDEVCSNESFLARVNNTLEPPSPESRENPLESGAPAPDSSPAELHSSPGPPVNSSDEAPDAKPTSDNPTSSEGNRRTIGKWFRKVTIKRSHDRAPRKTRAEVPPQSGAPAQARATPPNEKPSTMVPGKRQAVSVPTCVDIANAYLTTRLSGLFTAVDQRLVHASYPFVNTIAYRASQEKKPPKTTPRSEAGPANVYDETRPEPSGVQDNVEVSSTLCAWRLGLTTILVARSWWTIVAQSKSFSFLFNVDTIVDLLQTIAVKCI